VSERGRTHSSLTHSLTHSPTVPQTHPLTTHRPSLTHSLTHCPSLTHSLTHSLPHSLTATMTWLGLGADFGASYLFARFHYCLHDFNDFTICMPTCQHFNISTFRHFDISHCPFSVFSFQFFQFALPPSFTSTINFISKYSTKYCPPLTKIKNQKSQNHKTQKSQKSHSSASFCSKCCLTPSLPPSLT